MIKMVSKLILCLYLFSNVCILISVAEKDFFKVPLEIREKNRPKRLVDNVDDPDMRQIKSLQDKFFNIIGNSSVGREFKSFSQLLRLVDSESGKEIGKLFVNGFMLGFGKESSGQILTEFLDDFQYRLTPELADALVDYKDFMKTVDIKMIPQTIEMLFKKDGLGNSLAQMPLGQLVDLIQPELSRYGIDARSVINGIIGKGDSTFPDMVRKIMNNINETHWMDKFSGLIGFASKATGSARDDINTIKDDKSVENKKPNKDKTLMLFKPLIANLLKSNKIDLEADAVIQVLTPFIGGAGEYMQNIIPALKNGGKDINFDQLLPLLGLLSSQFSGNKNSKDQKPDLLGAAMSLMGGLENNNNIGNILTLASQFLGNKKRNKNDNLKRKTKSASPQPMDSVKTPSKDEENEFDPMNLLNMAASLGKDSNGGNGLNALSGLVNQFTKDSDFDANQMLNLASNLLGSITKSKKKSDTQPKTTEKLGKIKRSKTFPGALENFLLRIQSDKKCHLKLKDAFALGKNLFSKNMISLDQIKEQLPNILKSFKNGKNYDIETLLRPFSFTHTEWSEFLGELDNEVFRGLLITKTIAPATELISFIASDQFQKQQNTIIKNQLNERLSSFGLKGITLNNFPDRLSPLIGMMTRGWDLPVKIENLLEPLKYSLKETWSWYIENMKFINTLSRSELEELVATSLEDDFAVPLISVWKGAQMSKTTSSCLPRAICDVINDVPADHHLQMIVTRFGSIAYAGVRATSDDDFLLLIQTARAAVFQGDCQAYFPIKCSSEDQSKGGVDDSDKENNHEEL